MAYPMQRLDCGCIVKHHEGTGAKISVSRCQSHRRRSKEPNTLDLRYYKGLGTVSETGELIPGNYIQEFEDGMGQSIPVALPGAKAIEIGGGVSPYASTLVGLGYDYTLVEPSPVACDIMKSKLPGITTYPCLFPEHVPKDQVVPGTYEVVLSAHSLEHMKNAINALWNMRELLTPTGTLYLLIPNDDDLTNPDHFWFFNEQSIRKAAEICHLSLQKITVKQVVPHEKFMYCILERA